MGAYSFKKQFVELVREGSKFHTIRDKRKRREKPGNLIHCFYGMRTKHCELIRRSPCTRVQEIFISEEQRVLIDGVELSFAECNHLAYQDGFRSKGINGAFVEMMNFWEGRLPFLGDMIWWNPEILIDQKKGQHGNKHKD